MNFIAPAPSGSHPYFQRFIDFMASVKNGKEILEDWSSIEMVEDEISDEIISYLIVLACDCQHIANINIGRFYLQNSPKSWVIKKLKRLIIPLLSKEDSWNYYRALELFSTIDESLTQELALKASQHNDSEIKEAGFDFLTEK